MGFWRKNKDPGDEASPKVSFVWSTNMQLRVAAPVGEDWQRMEAKPSAELLAAIKCMRGAPPDALALDALVVVPPEGQGLTLEQLRERDWEAHYLGKMFSEVASLSVEEVEHMTRTGFADKACEIRVDGRLRHPDMQLRLRERHVPSGDKLLIASAAASPEVHQQFVKIVDSWLAHASLGG